MNKATKDRLANLREKIETLRGDLVAFESELKWADELLRPKHKAERVSARGWDADLLDADDILGNLINEIDDELAEQE